MSPGFVLITQVMKLAQKKPNRDGLLCGKLRAGVYERKSCQYMTFGLYTYVLICI